MAKTELFKVPGMTLSCVEPGIYVGDVTGMMTMDMMVGVFKTIGDHRAGAPACLITILPRAFVHDPEVRGFYKRYPELVSQVSVVVSVTESASTRMLIAALALGLRVIGIRMDAFATLEEAVAWARPILAKLRAKSAAG
jgi:hypothetical protein